MTLTLMLIALASLASIIIAIWFLRLRARHFRAAYEIRENIYNLAEALISDDYTPDLIADFSRFLCEKINSGKFLRSLIWDALTGKLNRISDELEDRASEFKEAFDSLPEERQEQFNKLFTLWIIAMTYNNFFVGTTLRQFIIFVVKNMTLDKVEVVYEDLHGSLCSA